MEIDEEVTGIDRRIPLVVVAALALVVLLSSTAQAEAVRVDGTLTTTEPSSLAGTVDAQARGGLHVGALNAEEAMTLEASEATVETEWERGRLVETPAGTPYRQVEESGRSVENLSNVRIEVGSWTEGTELLLAPTSPGSVDAQALGDVDVDPVPADRTLIRGGYSDETYGAGEEVPSYHYRATTPLVAAGPMDEAEVSGNLEVFANNATLELDHDEDERSTWTGFRITDTTGPSSEYELRVVVIHLEEASTRLDPTAGVTMLSMETELGVDGSLGIPGARGQLSGPERTLDFAEEEALLSGTGDLTFRAHSPGPSTDEPPLEASIAGEFELLSERSLATSSADLTAATPGSSGVWIALAVAGLLVLAGWWQLSRGSTTLTWLPAALRERLYDRCRQRATRLEDDGRRAEAARAYETMTRLRPRQPLGWYGGAINHLEAGRPARALTLVREARQQLDEVPLDLLELHVAAASEDDRLEEAKGTLVDLASASPRMADTLLDELQLEDLRGDPAVDEALDGAGRGWPSR